jgi:alkyl hydroperoxide reductase subunit AhpF
MMAISSPQVRADIVDLTEFPELADRYAVMGVPKTVLNDRLYFDGALPEPDVLAAVVEASRAAAEEARR